MNGRDRAVPRLGYVGFGEVAFHQSAGLTGEGLRGIKAFVDGPRHAPPYSPDFRAWVKSAGAELVGSVEDLCASTDVIISAVTPASAAAVAERCAPHLRPDHLYVDLNSCSPQRKVAVARPVLGAGARFVDAALMGGAPYGAHRQPLYVSGPGAEAFRALMTQRGMQIMVLDERVGTASTLKMIRSAATKGYLALLWEVGIAAQRAGIDLNRFGDVVWPLSLGPARSFETAAEAFVVRGALHFERRADEMADCLDTLRGLGAPTAMTDATARWLRRLASLGLREAVQEGRAAADLLDLAASAVGEAGGAAAHGPGA